MTSNLPPVLRPEHPSPIALGALAKLLHAWTRGSVDGVEVSGVTLVSGEVQSGDLYVAAQGANVHGAEFSAAARDRGAVGVLTDPAGASLVEESGLPVVVVESPRDVLPLVAQEVYGHVDATIELFGVTGTNGKTTTVHVLEGIMTALGETAGLSSTIERRIAGETVVSRLTTPEASEMHALIARMQEHGVTAAAIEVSAQALSRHRVDRLVFDVAGFTNLSHDHLDDYASMEEYFEAKLAFFEPDIARRAVVSLDTVWGDRVVERAGIPVTTIASVPGKHADWTVHTLSVTVDGTSFELLGPDGQKLSTTVPVLGEHMAADVGLAIVMLVEAGRSPAEIESALRSPDALATIPGRTENIAPPGAPAVYVDFGHSADAFAKTLDAVRAVTSGTVIMLFGADGDRDPSKRPSMAAAAVLHSDILVITDHHPRFEDPAQIRRVLAESAIAARPDAEIHVVSPPERAIRVAVSLALPGDAILWAGPGHQNYRDIRGVRTVYSARDEARAALRELGYV